MGRERNRKMRAIAPMSREAVGLGVLGVIGHPEKRA